MTRSGMIRSLRFAAAAVCAAAALLDASAGHTLDIEQLDVERDGMRFNVAARAVLAVPREALYSVLTDYDHLNRLDATLVESARLETIGNHIYLVVTRARVCVLFFCRVVDRVERIEERPPEEIVATALPERSDVALSVSRWKLEETGDGHTRVSYSLEVEPTNLPGFAGGAVRRNLERSVRASMTAAEQLAAGKAP